MRKLFPALIMILLTPGIVLAQGEGGSEQYGGDKAIFFSLHALGKLAARDFGSAAFGDTSSVGVGFGMKYYFSKQLALRFGLGFTSQTWKVKSETSTAEDKTSIFLLLVMPGFQYTVAQAGPVAGYVGGQVVFGTGSITFETSTTKDESTSTAFGAGAFLGVEWFIAKSVSLNAEYQLMFNTSSAKEKYTVSGSTTETDLPSHLNINLSSGSSATVAIAFYI